MGSSSYIDVLLSYIHDVIAPCREAPRWGRESAHCACCRYKKTIQTQEQERWKVKQDESLRTSTHTRTRPTDGLGYESYIQHPYRRGRTWRSAGEGRNEWMLDYNYRPINLIAVQAWGVLRGGATIDASKVIGGRLTRRRRWAQLSQRTHLLGADGEEI